MSIALEKIKVTKCEDVERIREENHRSNIQLEAMKKMMIKEIENMDNLREPARIRWFFSALVNGYFNKDLIPERITMITRLDDGTCIVKTDATVS